MEKSVLKWNRKSEAKNPYFYINLHEKKLDWKGLFTLEKLNELFDFSLCSWNGRKFSCWTWSIPVKTLSFSTRFSSEKNQLVSSAMKETLAVWNLLSCGMCRWKNHWEKRKKVQKNSSLIRKMLFNFWSIFSIAKRKILPNRSPIEWTNKWPIIKLNGFSCWVNKVHLILQRESTSKSKLKSNYGILCEKLSSQPRIDPRNL